MTRTTEQKLSRKEREALERRSLILEAAEEIFSEKGYHAASMEEVARRAEFGVGSLYKFFKSKDDLYSAMFEKKVDAFEPEMFEAMGEGASPEERLRSFFRKRCEIFWRYPNFFRIYYNESMGTHIDHRAGMTPKVRCRYEEFMKRIRELLREGIEAGQFSDKPIDLMLLVLEGTMHQYALKLCRELSTERNQEEEEIILELIINGLRAYN